MSFLFGTVLEDDLQSIKSNINKLAANQKKISHVVEENLTLLNDTREHVIQNRQAINNVISSVTHLQTQVQNVTQMIQNDIMNFEFQVRHISKSIILWRKSNDRLWQRNFILTSYN